MATHEQTQTGPETYQYIDDALEAYQASLESIITDHDAAASGVVGRHKDDIETWEQNGGLPNQRLEQVLGEAVVGVHEYTTTAENGVTQTTEEVEQTLVGMLPDEDNGVWAEVVHSAENFGADDFSIAGLLAEASGPQARAAMEAALDRTIWQQIRERAGNEGADSDGVRSLLGNASSEASRQAMKAALDRTIWQQIRERAGDDRVDEQNPKPLLAGVSNGNSRKAMRAAFDSIIFRQAETRIDVHGSEDLSVQTALNMASSAAARKVMADELRRRQDQDFEPAEEETFEQPFEEEPPTQEAPFEEEPPTEEEPFDFDPDGGFFTGGGPFSDERLRDMFEDMFDRARRARQGRRQRRQSHQQHRQTGGQPPHEEPPFEEPPREEPPREEEPPRQRQSRANPETEEIIRQAIAADRSVGWLAGADRRDVRRVINTVRTLREQAAAKGGEMTDRHIYLRYRRMLEQDDPNEQTLQSFQILSAMMGGDPKGKLPF